MKLLWNQHLHLYLTNFQLRHSLAPSTADIKIPNAQPHNILDKHANLLLQKHTALGGLIATHRCYDSIQLCGSTVNYYNKYCLWQCKWLCGSENEALYLKTCPKFKIFVRFLKQHTRGNNSHTATTAFWLGVGVGGGGDEILAKVLMFYFQLEWVPCQSEQPRVSAGSATSSFGSCIVPKLLLLLLLCCIVDHVVSSPRL